MSDLDPRLVAEVASDSRRGSGYLIAPGLVITALHVVVDVEGRTTIPTGLRPTVRLMGDVLLFRTDRGIDLDFRQDQRLQQLARHRADFRDLKLEAELIWPKPGDPIGGTDVALLKLTEPERSRTEPPETRLTLAPKGGREVGAKGFGYPTFYTEEDDNTLIRHTYRLRATYEPSGDGYAPLRSIEELVVTSACPQDPAEWRGLSGAAVFSHPHNELIGIVHDAALRIHGNNRLGMIPLTSIAEGEEFWHKTGFARPGSAIPEVFDIRERLFELDRRPEETYFRRWLRGEAPGSGSGGPVRDGPDRPSIVLVGGYKQDELDLCVQRFEKILRDQFPDSGNCYARVRTLDLGRPTVDVEIRREGLFREWAKCFTDEAPSGAEPELKEIVAAGLASPSRPRLVTLQHRDPTFSESCQDILDLVFQILADLPPITPPPVIFLCVIRGAKAFDDSESVLRREFEGKMAAVHAFLSDRAAGRPQIDWSVTLDDPSNCVSTDVETWIERVEKGGWRPDQEAVNELVDSIDAYNEVPFRFAKNAAQAKLKKFQRV